MLNWLKGTRKSEPRRTLVVVGATETAGALARGASGFEVVRLSSLDAGNELPRSAAAIVLAQGDETRDLESAKAIAAAAPASATVLGVVAQSQAMITALQDLDAAGSGLRVRPLSREARLARAVLKEHPFARLRTGGRPHPVIFGTGIQSAQLVLQLFRMMHLPGLAPRVSVVGPDAEAWLAALTAEVPSLSGVGTIAAVPAWPAANEPPSSVYVVDAKVFGAASPFPWYVPIYWLPSAGAAPEGALAVAQDDWGTAITSLFADSADVQATAIHELYLEERRQAGDAMGSRPSMRPWSELPERFRAASRHQADHIGVKLAHIGCHIVPSDSGPRFAFTTDDRETLAEAEHLRWAAVQMLDGWSYGPVRDDATKTTPLLVPYADLTGEIRDLDRLSVRAIPSQLGRAGRTIYRDLVLVLRTAPQAEPASGFEAGFGRLLASLPARYPQRKIVLTTSLASTIERRAANIALGMGAGLNVALTDPDALGSEGRALAARAETILLAPQSAPRPADLTLYLGAGPDKPDASERAIVLGADGSLRSAPWQ